MVRLPGETQRELHHARIAGECGDAGDATAGDVAARLAELRSVGDVEDLPAGFNIPALVNRNFLQQCGVEDVDARSAQRIAADIANGADSGRGVGIGGRKGTSSEQAQFLLA